ncbi:MAG: FecR domain-containing protein [Candidatus Delongbacteria bacterium]|nr:FecR domain-containing protein [Candidatus Delongbacteria bacterium]
MRYIGIILLSMALLIQLSCKNVDTVSNEQVRLEETKEMEIKAVIEDNEQKVEEGLIAEVLVEEKVEDIQKIETIQEKVSETVSGEIAEAVIPVTVDKPKASYTDEKGIVAYVEGKVKKKAVEESDWNVEVAEKAKVKSRESYRTMKKSRAELELSGMDILRLAPKTTIDLVALYEEAKDGKQKTDIKLSEGDLWAQVNSADDESEFMMDTDIAAAAITGTNFRMSKTGDVTEMKVYHGEVKISNSKKNMNSLAPKSVREFSEPKQTFGPKEVTGPKEVSLEEWVYVVKNMQQIKFDRTGKVISAGDFTAKDAEETTDWVKWNKIRDRQRGLK